MKQDLILSLTFLLFFSCQSSPNKTISPVVSNTMGAIDEIRSQKDTVQLEEYFADSTNIGRKSLNKIEVSNYRTADSNYVIIRFFSKMAGKWNLKSEFHFRKDDVTGCDTKLSDFNNDGLNDMTYISNIAARGANVVRRLFIYDKSIDNLIYMTNSEDFPNMLYNKELNCIDAFLVYGGCSTVFLKISGDSLREFASVELMDVLTVRTYDKDGKETIIFQDTTNKAVYSRYKNFKPLKEYDNY